MTVTDVVSLGILAFVLLVLGAIVIPEFPPPAHHETVNVEEIMERDVLTARLLTPVSDLASQMYENRRTSVPVVDDENHVVGIVTMTDLVVRNAHLHFPRYIKILDSVVFLESTKEYDEELRKVLASTAGELMSSPVMTVEAGTDASDAATQLFEHKITALPVVDEAGKLLGLVSQFEFVKLIVTEPPRSS